MEQTLKILQLVVRYILPEEIRELLKRVKMCVVVIYTDLHAVFMLLVKMISIFPLARAFCMHIY